MFLSFDTETRGLGGELLLITACSLQGDHVFKGENMVGDLFDVMRDYPYPFIWYAHHAQYDWRYFLEYIHEHEIQCEIGMRTETDIYTITLFLPLEDGELAKVVMRDSMAVFPGALKDFAKAFTPEIPKLEIDIANFNPDDDSHVEYAVRDTQILRKGMPRFNALLQKHFGVTVGHTTAGTAMKAWQHSLKDDEYYRPSNWGEREQFVRNAYYGGLVFLTTTGEIENGGDVAAETFDINSSYPDTMERYGVPYGRASSTTDYQSGLPGIYRVRVSAPDNLVVPIIPHRNSSGNMRWHRGSFDTTVTSAELIFAVNAGYVVEDVYEGVCYESMVFPFSDFIAHCKHLRSKYKGQPEEILAKLMQNSLYGKFGSRRERLSIFNPTCDDDTIGATPIDDAGYFWMRKEFSETLRAIPEWAVFITAHSRLKLLKQVYSIGVENVIYGDTDSITVRAGFADQFDQGNEYGQWKLEKQWQRFKAVAPKVYTGQLMDGAWRGAAKGLPRKKMAEAEWAALMNNEKLRINYDTLPSLRVAMQRGVSPAKPISRGSTNIANSSNWELNGEAVRPRIAACQLFP